MTNQREVHYYLVKGESQHADILTKLVPHDEVLKHSNALNSSQFITSDHMKVIAGRDNMKKGD